MKTFSFRFCAQLAKFEDNFVSIIYGGKETRLVEEVKECTWPEAQAHLEAFVASAPAPSSCSVSCLSAPMPRGFKVAKTRFHKEHATPKVAEIQKELI